MEFNGKKTERVLMRVSEDMAREVRAMAELEHRSIQDQFRYLISRALQHGLSGTAKETRARTRQAPSTGTFAESQTKATPSTPVASGQLLLPGTAGPIPARRRRQVA